MKTDKVSIKEAVRITGKSDATIRRWLRNLPKHEQKNIAVIAGRISIDRAFLLRSFDTPFVQVEGSAENETPGNMAAFERALSTLAGLVERLQEENTYLRAQLQTALLKAAKEEPEPDNRLFNVLIGLLTFAAVVLAWVVFRG